MRCDEIRDLLTAYAADELPPAQREFVELHQDQCPDCRRFLADLAVTRRQLDGLRDDRYQPQLAVRITDTIARRKLTGWIGRGARFAGTVAASILAVWLTVSVAQTQLPITGWGARPAPPPPGSVAYVVSGGQLLQVDTSQGAIRSVTPVDREATVTAGGGSQFLLSEGRLSAVNPSGGGLHSIALASGPILGASADGRTVYLLRLEKPDMFAVDTVTVATGEISRDLSPKPGEVGRSALSADGRYLYLIGTVRGVTYLKKVDLQTRQVETAHILLGFSSGATPLVGRDRLYVVDRGALAVLEPGREEKGQTFPIPELTPMALLSPEGALLTAREDGGLIEVDPASGKVVRQTRGARFTHLAWSDDHGHLYAAAGDYLEVIERSGLALVQRIKLTGIPARGLVTR